MLITQDVRVCEFNEDTGRNAYRYKLPADASGARSSVVVGGDKGEGGILNPHISTVLFLYSVCQTNVSSVRANIPSRV